jgi:hypothetical protein
MADNRAPLLLVTTRLFSLRLGLALLPRNDLLQRRHMPRKRTAACRSRGDRGLRLLADERFLNGNVTSLGQRLDLRAEIAVGGIGEFFQPREFNDYGDIALTSIASAADTI